MTAPSDVRTLVLHGLRLKGVAGAIEVTESVDTDPDHTAAVLHELAQEGLAVLREGRLSGYTLTPEGREQHASLLAVELDRAGARDDVHDAYQRFLGLNGDLLEVCTAWQLKGEGPDATLNDHSDAGYDAAVIERLGSLHEPAVPICDDLAASLVRYQPYGRRLTVALERVCEGEVDWFTKPTLPSYHTVWFELHEDLLVTLGIERGAEVPA